MQALGLLQNDVDNALAAQREALDLGHGHGAQRVEVEVQELLFVLERLARLHTGKHRVFAPLHPLLVRLLLLLLAWRDAAGIWLPWRQRHRGLGLGIRRRQRRGNSLGLLLGLILLGLLLRCLFLLGLLLSLLLGLLLGFLLGLLRRFFLGRISEAHGRGGGGFLCRSLCLQLGNELLLKTAQLVLVLVFLVVNDIRVLVRVAVLVRVIVRVVVLHNGSIERINGCRNSSGLELHRWLHRRRGHIRTTAVGGQVLQAGSAERANTLCFLRSVLSILPLELLQEAQGLELLHFFRRRVLHEVLESLVPGCRRAAQLRLQIIQRGARVHHVERRLVHLEKIESIVELRHVHAVERLLHSRVKLHLLPLV
mmetsp:Transcript_16312/g.63616  ORF Transcript_16312/g.63616 Transcript_16312/m.63616 type:complete len:367 (+) Transcript_16312:1018-2118(+)